LTLDAVRYHRIDVDNIPPGFNTAVFKLKFPIDTEDLIACMVTAGSVGLEFSSSVQGASSNDTQAGNARFDTITPRCAWFVYEVNKVKDARMDEEELFEQAYMEEDPSGRSYSSRGRKFRQKCWAKVETSTVLKILAVAGSDDDESLAGLYD
jgi:hypothetical protein